MLSLAVSASAIAGVMNSKPVLKDNSAPVAKQMVHKTQLNSPAPIMQIIKKQNQVQRIVPANDVRVIDKTTTRAVVNETPTGTAKYYTRAGSAWFVYYDPDDDPETEDYYYGYAEQDGRILTIEDGNTVWFKNLLFDPDGYWPDYWIKGTKSSNGQRITISLNSADIYYSSGYDAYVRLCMGTMTYTEANGPSFTRSYSQNATFTINGDVLTLQNSASDGNMGGTCLGCRWTDDNTWGGFADIADVFTVDTNLPEAPLMYTDDDVLAMAETGGELHAYGRTGDAIIVDGGSLYLDKQDGAIAYVYFAEDGSVYMRNPVYNFTNSTWVKGTLEGNKITVPLDQYVYWDDQFYGLRTSWGHFVNGQGYTAMPEVTECIYTINENNITLDNATDTTGLALTLDQSYVDQGWYGCLNWNTTYWNAPDMPTDLTVNPGSTTAVATWNGGDAEEWNVRYRQYNPNAGYYYCDFEDASEWGIFDMDGDGHYWGYRELEDGTYCVTSASWDRNEGALTPDNWLVSPVVNLNGVVRFKAWGQDPDWASEVIRVYVTTNPDYETTDDFEAISDDIVTLPLDEEGGSNIYSFDLSAYAGQQGCIAIRHYNISDMFMVNIDDFFVGDADAPIYEWITVPGVTEIPYTITGLTPETIYEVQVQAVNGGAITEWTESTIFTTLAEQAGLRGDVDDNGVVNIQDVTCLINHLLTQQWDDVPGQFSLDNADCDLNGTPNIQDVTCLINYLLSHVWPE